MKKLLILLLISTISFGQQDQINKIIERNNLLSGKMIDEMLMFNKAFVSGDLFYYDYTLKKNCEKYKTEFNRLTFEKIISENIKKSINTTEEFKIIGENGKTIIFKYNCPDQIIAELRFEYNAGLLNYIREDSEWNESVDLMYEKLIKPLIPN